MLSVTAEVMKSVRKIREAQLLIRKKLHQGVPLDIIGDSGGMSVNRQWRQILDTLTQ